MEYSIDFYIYTTHITYMYIILYACNINEDEHRKCAFRIYFVYYKDVYSMEMNILKNYFEPLQFTSMFEIMHTKQQYDLLAIEIQNTNSSIIEDWIRFSIVLHVRR